MQKYGSRGPDKPKTNINSKEKRTTRRRTRTRTRKGLGGGRTEGWSDGRDKTTMDMTISSVINVETVWVAQQISAIQTDSSFICSLLSPPFI